MPLLDQTRLSKLARSAVPRIAISAPAKKSKAVSEASTVDVSTGDLADDLGPYRKPDEIMLPRPSAIPWHATIAETWLAKVRSKSLCRI